MTTAAAFGLDDPRLPEIFDELPIWSAPFGQALLDRFRYRERLTVLDVGCGTGFPAIELAQRLGGSGMVYGLDPWHAAVVRAKAKAGLLQAANVEFLAGLAESMPFHDRRFDAIVSNNGLNNVADLDASLAECRRVARAASQMVLTVNLPDTMREFYEQYEAVLRERSRHDSIRKLHEHIRTKRKPPAFLRDRLAAHGFSVVHCEETTFTLRYVNGTALFNHFFIRLAFLGPWRLVADGADVDEIFSVLEARLNETARASGGLVLTVPFVCIEATPV
ncbi:methyltransferase domain-containing protein [Candidatus Binatia bacterium]|nr:methyltransferase domain-containing protein [Candidatus Binatia bacterium]